MSIKIDDLAREVMKGLDEYADVTTEQVKKAVRKAGNTVRKEIQQNAPKNTGDYAKSWAVKKVRESSHTLELVVHLRLLEKSVGENEEDDSHLDLFSLELFENIAYIMAKHADPSIPDSPEEWLDEFNTFSIYQILPQLIELWGLNTEVEIESKKNFAQLTAK